MTLIRVVNAEKPIACNSYNYFYASDAALIIYSFYLKFQEILGLDLLCTTIS